MPAFITDSARKHGVDDADIWHCYRYPSKSEWDEEDEMYFAVGFDRAGRLIEVGFFTRDDGTDVIVHAMRRATPLMR